MLCSDLAPGSVSEDRTKGAKTVGNEDADETRTRSTGHLVTPCVVVWECFLDVSRMHSVRLVQALSFGAMEMFDCIGGGCGPPPVLRWCDRTKMHRYQLLRLPISTCAIGRMS